jgi:hypothetical protein
MRTTILAITSLFNIPHALLLYHRVSLIHFLRYCILAALAFAAGHTVHHFYTYFEAAPLKATIEAVQTHRTCSYDGASFQFNCSPRTMIDVSFIDGRGEAQTAQRVLYSPYRDSRRLPTARSREISPASVGMMVRIVSVQGKPSLTRLERHQARDHEALWWDVLWFVALAVGVGNRRIWERIARLLTPTSRPRA